MIMSNLIGKLRQLSAELKWKFFKLLTHTDNQKTLVCSGEILTLDLFTFTMRFTLLSTQVTNYIEMTLHCFLIWWCYSSSPLWENLFCNNCIIFSSCYMSFLVSFKLSWKYVVDNIIYTGCYCCNQKTKIKNQQIVPYFLLKQFKLSLFKIQKLLFLNLQKFWCIGLFSMAFFTLKI